MSSHLQIIIRIKREKRCFPYLIAIYERVGAEEEGAINKIENKDQASFCCQHHFFF